MKKETAHRTSAGYSYKGETIRKKTYAMYNCTWWIVGDKSFNTLKEAKEYIDSKEVQ